MNKIGVFVVTFLLIITFIVFNIFAFYHPIFTKNMIILFNIIFLFFLSIYFVLIFILQEKSYNIILKKKGNTAEACSEDLVKYQKFHQATITFLVQLRDFLKQIALLNKTDENSKEEMEKIFNTIDISLYKEPIDKISKIFTYLIEKVDYEQVFKILEQISKLEEFVIITHKISFLSKLLMHSLKYTEEATMDLIEKFDKLSTEVYSSKNDAENNLKVLKEGIQGKSFKAMISESNHAIREYDNFINRLIKINSNNGEKLQRVGEWIRKINEIITSIRSISEKNNIIAINSSIEAARLGEQGKGFRILATEIRELNIKIDSFTKDIQNIMEAFNDFNDQILSDWSGETKMVINNIKDTSIKFDQILTMLISSYNMSSDSFEKSTERSNKVEKYLNEVMVSLQFQDITRQQIESVIDLMSRIKADINNQKDLFITAGIDIYGKNQDFFNFAKFNVLENIKHFDIDQIKQEFEEETL